MSADVTSSGRARREPGPDGTGDLASPLPDGPDPSGTRDLRDARVPDDPRSSRSRGARTSRRSWRRPAVWLPLLVALVLIAAVWTAVAAASPYVLPSLPSVGQELVTKPGNYLRSAGSTLGVAGAGLGIGFAAAATLAVAMSEVTVLRRALMPLAVVLNVTPVVALAPGLVIAFGFGAIPKVVVTAIIVFFPVLVNTSTGLRSVDPGALQVLTTLDASRGEVLRRLRVPSAAPYVFAALRVVVPLSLVGAVVAEFVAAGSSSGLGTVIALTASTSLPAMFAAIACLAVMGVVLMALVTAAERRALHWHHSQRGSAH